MNTDPCLGSVSLNLSGKSDCHYLSSFEVVELDSERVVTWFYNGHKALEHIIPKHCVPYTWQVEPNSIHCRRISYRDFTRKGEVLHEFKIFRSENDFYTRSAIPTYTLPSVDDVPYVQSKFRNRVLLGTFKIEMILRNQNTSLQISKKRPLKLWYKESSDELTFTIYSHIGDGKDCPKHLEFNVVWFDRHAHRKQANTLALTLATKPSSHAEIDQASAHGNEQRRSSIDIIMHPFRRNSQPSYDKWPKFHERESNLCPKEFADFRSVEIQFMSADEVEIFLAKCSPEFLTQHTVTEPDWQRGHVRGVLRGQPQSRKDVPYREDQKKAIEWWAKMIFHQKRIFNTPAGPKGPVKVAIIDTGIDIANPFIAHHWKTSQAISLDGCYRDFLDDVETANTLDEVWEGHYTDEVIRSKLNKIVERDRDEPQDLHGHGTHMAGIILQLAPHAQLYVARFMKQKSVDTQDARRLALAILFAAVIWDVDIISLSIGFDHDSMSSGDRRVIRNALKFAEVEKNIVVLAAASNSSNREKLQFPANQDKYVICINSSDGYGQRSRFNPLTQEQHKSDNFSILGEHVKSTWKQDAVERVGLIERDRNGAMWKWDEGTSVATAIAAAVTALIFQFGRTSGKTCAFAELETPEAVRRIFHLMAGKKNEEKFKDIIPWKAVFNSHWKTANIRLVIENEIADLM